MISANLQKVNNNIQKVNKSVYFGMKRLVLLSFVVTMFIAAAVSSENSGVNKEASAFVVQPNIDVQIVNVVDYNVELEAIDAGESISGFAPVAMWSDVIIPVDIQPPAADAKVFNSSFNANLRPSNHKSDAPGVKYRWNSYSDRANLI
jgi:hypothetical protein